VREARRAEEEGRASSVSAYVSDALARQRRADELAELIEEMVAEHGEPTAADRSWARCALGLE
jgi:hypothetical protein